MGNNQSSSESHDPKSPTAGSGSSGGGGAAALRSFPTREGSTRSKLASRKGRPITSTTEATNALAKTLSNSPSVKYHSHARARSITTPKPISEDISDSSKSDTSAMGQADSKPDPRPPSRSNTLPPRTTPPPRQRESTPDPKSPTSPEAKPVDVPPAHGHDGSGDKEDDFVPGYAESPYSLAPANFSRPPRLPLPIEEEVHVPGSPIISPQELEDVNVSKLENADIEEGRIPRKTSVLSSTTVDDDEVGDNDAFALESSQWGDVRVPTRLEWNGPGDKVFVTGTFCNWEKKMKLHRNKDGSDGFSATVQLPPGTHHVKFLVDGEMVTSNGLPTTVDWTNILVNYIEIVAPLPPAKENVQQPPEPAVPMAIPGTAQTAGQATPSDEGATKPETQVPETGADPSTLQEAVPNADHGGSVAQPIPGTVEAASKADTSQSEQDQKQTSTPVKPQLPRPTYTSQIPEFLIDLDNYSNPEDERFQRAQKVANSLPQPPSLPMFLSKSILNGTTPHKDDASVLIMPNHTVLNHLATSSIKSGVLATSGTTRYKRKFLTTIMYKPTSDDG